MNDANRDALSDVNRDALNDANRDALNDANRDALSHAVLFNVVLLDLSSSSVYSDN